MAKKPFVSVIIPTHNRAHFLRKAVNSVLKQTYKDFEIIIVDDSSIDNTKEIIKEFKDKRIKYFLKKRKPHNPAATRNDGIKRAKGEYIAFLDDDNEWLPEKLKIQLKCFEKNSKTGLVYTKYYDVYDGKKIEKKDIDCSAVIIKKRCIDECGIFDEKLVCAEDRDLWMRIMQKYNESFIDKILVLRKIHEKQVSSDIKNKIESEKYFIKKYYKELKNKHTLGKYLFALGVLYVEGKKFKKAKECFERSMKLNPFLRTKIYKILLKISPSLHRKMLMNIFPKIKNLKKF